MASSITFPDGSPERMVDLILRSTSDNTRHSILLTSSGTYWGLDIGELLQGAGWEDRPDHVQHVVDGDLQGDGVHKVVLPCEGFEE